LIENPQTFNLEYAVTVRSEVFLKYGPPFMRIVMYYVISSANDAIYKDALEVSKENAFPKVSYTLSPHLLIHNRIATLYQQLNSLVLINDV